MTKEKTESKTSSKAPSHYAYHVRNREDGKAFWTKIGIAWEHGDQQGFTAQIDCLPLDGRISLRLANDKAPQAA